MLKQIPLSLYIHFPWCLRKCPYCDFNSHHKPEHLPEQAYLAALVEDLAHDCQLIANRPIQTIFLGGGTPSLFSAESLNYLLEQLAKRLNFAGNIEITLEANPGTFEQQRFKAYRQAGINRLSIGIQSFDDRQLKNLGRIHCAAESLRAVTVARDAGFDNINLDLMFGLPEQTIEEGLQDLKQSLALQPSHLSWYQLTLEPNTLFYKHPPRLPQSDLIWEMQCKGQELLEAHGFTQYEVSAYAQSNKQCQHNLNYWQFGDYLGIGAGAHGKISQHLPLQIKRYHKTKHPTHYLNRDRKFIAEEKTLTSNEKLFEFMLNVLRLKEGVTKELFYQRTGLTESILAKPIAEAMTKELLVNSPTHFQASALGWRFLDDLTSLFLVE